MRVIFFFLGLFFVQSILQCKLLQKYFSFPENADQLQLSEFTKENKSDRPNLIGILFWVSGSFLKFFFLQKYQENFSKESNFCMHHLVQRNKREIF